jgi:hypothetical protein
LEPTNLEPLTVDQKQAIFKALVESQDAGMTVEESRSELAKVFSLSMDQVVSIEREGLDEEWPPL